MMSGLAFEIANVGAKAEADVEIHLGDYKQLSDWMEYFYYIPL